ncbi:Uncharacterised protein [Mycobacteroides abscessus subsp. abscessus]|nr:Uncharacterised protein [Mycobacteroides abscessus subsp. abscessus]SKS34724.1 Uncharacterised protein [Mycobacteroides abscessus subsp. massiliense]
MVWLVQSPAATMSGSLVRAWSSITMPLSTDNPAAEASSVFGTTPTPTMTKSAGIGSPPASTTSCTLPLPEKASTRACVRISTPSPLWIRV